MELLKDNLVIQFSVASLLVIGTVALVLAFVLSDKIHSDEVDDLVAEAVGGSSGKLFEALNPDDLRKPMTGEQYESFHKFVQQSIVSDRTARIRIWAADGTVVYSSDPEKVGERFAASEQLLTALTGEVAVEQQLLQTTEQEEGFGAELLGVDTPIFFPGTAKPVGAFEISQFYAPTAARIDSMRRWLFSAVGLGLGTLYLGLVSIVWRGSNTINKQKRALEEFNTELKAMVNDRTAQLEGTQEDLVFSQRLAAIGELSGGIAHELMTPLASIKNETYFIRKKVGERQTGGINSNKKLADFLDIMDEQIDRSDRIMAKMMDYSREREPVFTPSEVEKIIESALRRIDVNESINVVKNFDPNLPPVLLGGPRITQALEAIFSNAAESMPHGGDLSIGVDWTDKYLIIEIRDTGIGISESDLAKLSDPLFSTKNRGMGMGLALADEVVKKHNGVINVSSVPEQGTTVMIMLPLEQPTDLSDQSLAA